MSFSELNVSENQTARTEALANWLFGKPRIIGEINGSIVHGSRETHWTARAVIALFKAIIFPFTRWQTAVALIGLLVFAPIW